MVTCTCCVIHMFWGWLNNPWHNINARFNPPKVDFSRSKWLYNQYYQNDPLSLYRMHTCMRMHLWTCITKEIGHMRLKAHARLMISYGSSYYIWLYFVLRCYDLTINYNSIKNRCPLTHLTNIEQYMYISHKLHIWFTNFLDAHTWGIIYL